jgi:hypothetical protein
MDIGEWETLSTKISFERCFKEGPGRNLRRIIIGNYAARRDKKKKILIDNICGKVMNAWNKTKNS